MRQIPQGSEMEQLKVFISSTQKDLQQERDSVESLINDLGHRTLRAETLNSPGTSPKSACETMARECDIYLGIFGARYGYVVPELHISATEMEFREARNHNPSKVFVYLKKVDKLERRQKNFLDKVQDFSAGYFRHRKFETTDELVGHLRSDIITWTTRQIRRLVDKDLEVEALRDKVSYLSRVMAMYGIQEELR